MQRNSHDPSKAEPEIETVVFLEAARFGVLLGGFFLFFNWLMLTGWDLSIILGICGAIACAAFRYPEIKKVYKRLEDSPPSFDDETVLMEGYANHHRSLEGLCPGYMCLTDKQIHFWYYPFNDEKWETRIQLRNIDRIETFSRYYLFPKGIRIILANGKKQIITVQKWRDGWFEEVYKAWRKQSYLGPEPGFVVPIDN